MKKKILGLDLGTNSIGWALIEITEDKNGKIIDAKIIKLGVRAIQYDTFSKVDRKSGKVSESKNPVSDFSGGKSISPNAFKTQKHGARINLQRYKLRRKNLYDLLLKNELISEKAILTEDGKGTTHQTLQIRAKAANESVGLEEFARVLFAINKKRGYKSSRKIRTEEDGTTIDGMKVARDLYENNFTPGQYVLQLLKEEKKYIPEFYPSDLQQEFDRIWNEQKRFYPEILTNGLYKDLQDKNKSQTWAICEKPFDIVGIKLEGKPKDQKIKRYQFREKGLKEKLHLEYLAIALQEINNEKKQSSGYLGAISDRSKSLYVNNKTVGEYLYEQIRENRHTSLKNQIFYRQDYLDEFEQIWETQARYHAELTPELKAEIRDVIIFFQRKLKTKKGLLSFCQFESWEEDRKDENGELVLNKLTGMPKKRMAGQRVVPRSSPLFQEFRIWQNINNLEFWNEKSWERIALIEQDDEIRQALFEELNLRGNQKNKEIINFLKRYFKIGKSSEWKCNYEEVHGNNTNKALFEIFQTIAEKEGYGFEGKNKTAKAFKDKLKEVFSLLKIKTEILDFSSQVEGNEFINQLSYQLWHLLYSAEDDSRINKEDQEVYGNSDVNLKKKIHQKFGFKPEYAAMLANVSLEDDHGNLSARAIRKILPFMEEGNKFSDACALAGYNHSGSLTKEELVNRKLKERLEIIPKNNLRNPVVEKILNQMINLVNQVCDQYGKPNEIRIELARELKKSIKERESTTKAINNATKINNRVRDIIKKDFGFTPTKNDIVRYKLWEELAKNGYKTLFTDQKIGQSQIFSKDIDIEHIIPKALLFDDSFSNKTLAYRTVNLQKKDRTALDFITQDHNSDLQRYKSRIEVLYKDGVISKAKYKKLLMSSDKLPDGFIERDLRNSQYIAKKAKAMLQGVFETVVSTSGNITDKLREDWDLINVMKELNLPKYKALGLTEIEKRWDSGQEKFKEVEVIKDWTKRNDHRHHAMDALTVAFTSHNHIQYVNYLNARKNESHKKHANIIAIENLITEKVVGKNGTKKRKFIPPMKHFRNEAKKHIEDVLISFKTRNKVVTRNINEYKKSGEITRKMQLTPRGQLHEATVYGKIIEQGVKEEKLGAKMTFETALKVCKPKYKDAILRRLSEFGNDAKKAFTGKNAISKNPVYIDATKQEQVPEKIKVHVEEKRYTIRKEIGPDLKLDKIIDEGVKRKLKTRLNEYGGDAAKAFSDIEKNPIWLNEEAGVAIKRVRIYGVKNAETLHDQRDHKGNLILNEEGKTKPVDFVSTGNNHHIAIYKNAKGELIENVVSLFNAVKRVNLDLPLIVQNTSALWNLVLEKNIKDQNFLKSLPEDNLELLFTMKQNEMFVFPSNDFNPTKEYLLDEKNAKIISKHLYRVQSISERDYWFRHHLDATTNKIKELSELSYKRKRNPESIKDIVKVRLDHLGRVAYVGEEKNLSKTGIGNEYVKSK
jgi:CRISPR-associated endonuclease Csn1